MMRSFSTINKTLLKWLAVYMATYVAFTIFWMMEGSNFSHSKGDKELSFLAFSFLSQYAFMIIVLLTAGWRKFLIMLFIPPAVLLLSVITSYSITELITGNSYDRQVLIAYAVINGIFFLSVGLIISLKVNVIKL